MRRIAFASILPALLLGIVSCASVKHRVSVPLLKGDSVRLRRVRVLLELSTETKPLMVSSPKEVTVYSGDQKHCGTISIDNSRIALTSRGAVTVDGKSWNMPTVILVPSEGEGIFVGDTLYPGYLVLMKRGEAVNVINHVEMEEYVACVVPREMPGRFTQAAHEAQAVAARTYALAEMRRRHLLTYDLHDDQRSQVYGGLTGSRSFGTRAARNTEGVVLVYDWRFLNAFYHSTCGGHTARASQLSGAPRIKPFTGVECDHCKRSPSYKWVKLMSIEEVEAALAQGGYVSGDLEDIKVVETLDGGWVDMVEVVSTGGRRRLAGNAFRKLMGTDSFYSPKFEVQRSEDGFVIQGRGRGHGVGMCQWGASGLGRLGKNYAEILRYYYSGADLVKIY